MGKSCSFFNACIWAMFVCDWKIWDWCLCIIARTKVSYNNQFGRGGGGRKIPDFKNTFPIYIHLHHPLFTTTLMLILRSSSLSTYAEAWARADMIENAWTEVGVANNPPFLPSVSSCFTFLLLSLLSHYPSFFFSPLRHCSSFATTCHLPWHCILSPPLGFLSMAIKQNAFFFYTR